MSRIYLFVVFALMSMRPAVAQQDNAAAPADNKAAQNAASNEAEAQASDAGAPAKQPADPSPASLAARAAFDEILQQYQSQDAEIRAMTRMT